MCELADRITFVCTYFYSSVSSQRHTATLPLHFLLAFEASLCPVRFLRDFSFLSLHWSAIHLASSQPPTPTTTNPATRRRIPVTAFTTTALTALPALLRIPQLAIDLQLAFPYTSSDNLPPVSSQTFNQLQQPAGSRRQTSTGPSGSRSLQQYTLVEILMSTLTISSSRELSNDHRSPSL